MKRAALFIVAIAGAGIGMFLALQGSSYDLSQYWQWFISLYRRTSLKTQSIASDDPFAKALDLIAGFEGFRSKAYPDANGYSIGYGHFIKQGDPYDSNSEITEEEAYSLLYNDAQNARLCVQRSVTAPMNANQQASLISLVYNIGCGNFQQSTLLKKLNAQDYEGASAEFPRWTRSQGNILQSLVDRRNSEMEVFNS